MSAAPQHPIRSLPATPSLNSLKSQAKQLLSRQRKGEAESNIRFVSSHPDWTDASESDIQSAALSLADAQLVVAREYGFDSWPKLKHHVEAAVPNVPGILSERPDRIVDEHLASLKRRNRPFAELLRRTMIFQGFSNETTVAVDVTRSTYGAYIATLPNPCCIYTYWADQEYYGQPTGNRGPAILEIPPQLSGALLDGVDSGSQRMPDGKDSEARRKMTLNVTTILAHFESIWNIHPSFRVTDAELETDPGLIVITDRSHREHKQDVRVDIPAEEPTIVVSFDVVSPDVSGTIRLCHLHRTLENIVLPRRFAKGKANHYKGSVLEGSDRLRAKPLFESHARGRVEIDSVLEDHGFGMVVVDDVKSPTVAQVTYYDECGTLSTNTWYGGDIDHPVLKEWISHPPTSVVPETAEWEQRLIAYRGLPTRRVACVEFEPTNVDLEYLRRVVGRVPEDVKIVRVDASLGQRILDGFWPSFVNNYADVEDFTQRGVGFCALVNGEPAMVVVANVVSEKFLRLTWKENPGHSERRPLALATSARLVEAAMEEGREVRWWIVGKVDNWPGEAGVALGFEAREPYEMLVWEGDERVK